MAVYLTGGEVRGRLVGQNLEGSFSAVSTLQIARVGSFRFFGFRALSLRWLKEVS